MTLVYCGQTVGWIKMKLGMEVDLGPGHIVLDGDPTPSHKGAQPPTFGPCLLWTNDWLDQGATLYGGRPRPRRHCVRCGPISLPKKIMRRQQPPLFGRCIVVKRLDGSRCHLVWSHIVLDGDPAPPPQQRGVTAPTFRPMSIVTKRLDGSKCHLV